MGLGRLAGLPRGETIQLFENADKTTYKQAVHTLDAAKLMEGKDYIDLCAGIIQYLWRCGSGGSYAGMYILF